MGWTVLLLLLVIMALGAEWAFRARNRVREPAYFCAHPAVSSDLVLLMAGHLDAGPGTQRPLAKAGGGVWLITDGYPGPGRGNP